MTIDEDTARIFRLNLRLSTETLMRAALDIEALGLEPKEFFILDAVDDRPYPAELSRHLSMPKPTMTLYLKNLQSRGLLIRAIDPQDLRRHRLGLTVLGRDVLNKAQAHLFGQYSKRLARLTEREHAEFARLLKKLTDQG